MFFSLFEKPTYWAVFDIRPQLYSGFYFYLFLYLLVNELVSSVHSVLVYQLIGAYISPSNVIKTKKLGKKLQIWKAKRHRGRPSRRWQHELDSYRKDWSDIANDKDVDSMSCYLWITKQFDLFNSMHLTLTVNAFFPQKKSLLKR